MLVEILICGRMGKRIGPRGHTGSVFGMRVKRKGVQGLSDGVWLEMDKKESWGLWSYRLVHDINSILLQEVFLILFLQA
jgi:hypothetical protein